MPSTAIDLLDEAIAALEAKLNLAPGASLAPASASQPKASTDNQKKGNKAPQKGEGKKQKKEKKPKANNAPKKKPAANLDQPDICKLEFKVGVITKVWVHPEADKLYCEEIDCGEEKPRQIASGLRLHYDEATMLGQRLLVVSNLKVSLVLHCL